MKWVLPRKYSYCSLWMHSDRDSLHWKSTSRKFRREIFRKLENNIIRDLVNIHLIDIILNIILFPFYFFLLFLFNTNVGYLREFSITTCNIFLFWSYFDVFQSIIPSLLFLFNTEDIYFSEISINISMVIYYFFLSYFDPFQSRKEVWNLVVGRIFLNIHLVIWLNNYIKTLIFLSATYTLPFISFYNLI